MKAQPYEYHDSIVFIPLYLSSSRAIPQSFAEQPMAVTELH